MVRLEEQAVEHWRKVLNFPKSIIRKLTIQECIKLDSIIVKSHVKFAKRVISTKIGAE